jgi:hypothetical protein
MPSDKVPAKVGEAERKKRSHDHRKLKPGQVPSTTNVGPKSKGVKPVPLNTGDHPGVTPK